MLQAIWALAPVTPASQSAVCCTHTSAWCEAKVLAAYAGAHLLGGAGSRIYGVAATPYGAPAPGPTGLHCLNTHYILPSATSQIFLYIVKEIMSASIGQLTEMLSKGLMGCCHAVAAFSIPPVAAPGPGGLQTRVLGPPSSRQERIAPGVAPSLAPVQAPMMSQAPAPGLKMLGPGITSAANVPIVVRVLPVTQCSTLLICSQLSVHIDI